MRGQVAGDSTGSGLFYKFHFSWHRTLLWEMKTPFSRALWSREMSALLSHFPRPENFTDRSELVQFPARPRSNLSLRLNPYGYRMFCFSFYFSTGNFFFHISFLSFLRPNGKNIKKKIYISVEVVKSFLELVLS